MRLGLYLVGAMLFAASACSGDDAPSPTPETFTLTATYVIDGVRCDAVAGSTYATVPGAAVAITDGSNSLASVKVATQGLDKVGTTGCSFSLVAPNLPRKESYTLSGGVLGDISYSFAELSNANWRVTLKVN